jgi:hypothetical protein
VFVNHPSPAQLPACLPLLKSCAQGVPARVSWGMSERPRPLPSDEEDIAPDIAQRREEPIDPDDAIHRENDMYGDDSQSPNRDDEYDEHHGEPDDIV